MGEVWQFHLGGPPREVPAAVQVRVLLGGFLNQFGWVFLGFGLIFVWVFGLNADVTSWRHFRGEVDAMAGTITRTEKTGFNEGGSDNRDGTPVYACHYSFTATDGRQYTGVSYRTMGQPPRMGEQVVVEYPRGKAHLSRIQGMRRKPMGPLALITGIFPVVGLGFILSGIRRAVKGNRLLRRGELATGRLISKTATNTKINDQTVYKMTFEFEAGAGRTCTVTAKTHTPQRLEDEHEEPLLYDPAEPERAVLLDNLPGSPRIDEGGNIRAGSPAGALLSLAVPAATVAGHGWYIWFRFFR